MEHYYKGVPGWAAFKNLYVQAVRDASNVAPSVFVEIGSWLGRSAAFMGVEILNSKKPIHLYCVDPWVDGGPDLRDTKFYRDLNGVPPKVVFERNVVPVASKLTAIQATSQEAVHKFANASIDFLMIDGDHSYEAVKADIASYLPKMKPGAVMSGDDYLWPGVKQAVDEAFKGRAVVTITKKHADYRNSASYWQIRV